jgi:hypothetical protein
MLKALDSLPSSVGLHAQSFDEALRLLHLSPIAAAIFFD